MSNSSTACVFEDIIKVSGINVEYMWFYIIYGPNLSTKEPVKKDSLKEALIHSFHMTVSPNSDSKQVDLPQTTEFGNIFVIPNINKGEQANVQDLYDTQRWTC